MPYHMAVFPYQISFFLSLEQSFVVSDIEKITISLFRKKMESFDDDGDALSKLIDNEICII